MRKNGIINKISSTCKNCTAPIAYWHCKVKKYCSQTCYWQDKKGKPSGYKPTLGMTPWNKGLTGLPSGKKGKHYPQQSGEHHWNWRGGVSTERHLAMNSFEYKAWRTAVFERDDFTCQDCGERGVTLHADHLKRWADFPELRYDVDNGRTLCIPCHYYVTFGRLMPSDAVWGSFHKKERVALRP